MPMQSVFEYPLNGEWRLSGRPQDGPAFPVSGFDEAEFRFAVPVPGNIEDALSGNGVVPDPYWGVNSRFLRPYEFYEWLYERNFEYDGVPRKLELVLAGVDTLGTVFLNDERIGEIHNAFCEHRLAFSPVKGKNTLAIHLASTGRALEAIPFNAGAFAGGVCFNYENLRFRRPAHETGWDIAPRMALGGVFRSVRMEEIPKHRFVECYLQTLSLEGTKAVLRCGFHVATPFLGDPDVKLVVKGNCGEKTFYGERILWSSQGNLTFDAPAPELWQPRHYGHPFLYDTRIQLVRREEVLAEKRFNFGIRTVELRCNSTVSNGPEPDFQFIVNGKAIRTYGVNHVPADALHSHDAARLPLLLDKAVELDCGIIRVWGGGIYEPDSFYDRCDREGILVWQDFMMACAQYPNDASFQAEIEREAEWAVRRLRQHPSLVLWCGDNECDMVPQWSGMPRSNPEANILTRGILPEVCRRHDPLRPYLPSSPWYSSEATAAAGGGDPLFLAPEQHLWGDRGYFKGEFYRNSRASFVSETGYHGCANVSSLRKYLPENALYPEGGPEWFVHASNANWPYDLTNNYRIPVMRKQFSAYFTSVPDTLEDFAAASQIVQAEAVKFLLENYRGKTKNAGLILWNLADCWPQCSEALLDYYNTPKLSFHYLARLLHPVLLMCGESGEIRGVNDGCAFATGHLTVECGGRRLLELPFELAPGENRELVELPLEPGRNLLRLRWRLDSGETGVNHQITGAPFYEYAHFRNVWLPEIAALDGSFQAEDVAR